MATDDIEDRCIAALMGSYACISFDAVPQPRFAWIPSMKSMKTDAKKALKITRRDARHYFHQLKVSRKWQRW